MAYLINISSNHQPKLYIGSALTHLSKLADMLVSSTYKSIDRSGGDTVFYNCALILYADTDLQSLTQKTKALEVQLGRKAQSQPSKVQTNITVDIDILAEQVNQSTVLENANSPETNLSNNWQFITRRLPLPDDACWALKELGVALPNEPAKTDPKLACWHF